MIVGIPFISAKIQNTCDAEYILDFHSIKFEFNSISNINNIKSTQDPERYQY